MYYKNTLDGIRAELERRAILHEKAAEAWSKAEVAKKKNGEEFAEIGRAFRGCKRYAEFGFDRIHVVFSTPSKMYESDDIDIFGYCDTLPDDDPRKVKNSGCWRTKYTLTAEEIRKAIADKIDWHRKTAADYREQIKVYREAAKEYREAVEEAEAKLKAYGFTSLFYLVTD